MERAGCWWLGLLDRNGDERLVGLFNLDRDTGSGVHILWQS